ncbi:hypothetical protein RTG_01130 [Rhodotorula toruloides ATCC 204091]|uniref:Uncharacterized protein n=1 Tax=Rhodotorula toruloides TaxID=5286 RepID=A0A0K3C6M1_RHOTO|nr:hypothetical protein RTG_01130 [Rhodotorula toruloides ATCC 204091]KAK4333403.1 hypothetical protein RTBOTA2_002141 [Rhodotorula toruloides]PRQ77458.1 hypothetical protein AAT19DRAFT_8526 [Rhodotorula toruloides]
MARFALTFAAIASLASLAAAQDLRVNTPSQIYSCQPAAFTYTCPSTPCTIVARPSKDQSSILENLGDVSDKSGSVSWKPVDVAEGTSVTLWITDANGNTISSAAITVAQGTSTSCLAGSSGSSDSPASSGASGSSHASAATKAASASASSMTKSAASAASQTASKAGAAAASMSGSANSTSSSPSASASAGSDTGSGAGIDAVVKTSLLAIVFVGSVAILA